MNEWTPEKIEQLTLICFRDYLESRRKNIHLLKSSTVNFNIYTSVYNYTYNEFVQSIKKLILNYPTVTFSIQNIKESESGYPISDRPITSFETFEEWLLDNMLIYYGYTSTPYLDKNEIRNYITSLTNLIVCDEDGMEKILIGCRKQFRIKN